MVEPATDGSSVETDLPPSLWFFLLVRRFSCSWVGPAPLKYAIKAPKHNPFGTGADTREAKGGFARTFTYAAHVAYELRYKHNLH